MMGKFKNKKVVVKDISWNDKGDLLINGRPALKIRIPKKSNIFSLPPNSSVICAATKESSWSCKDFFNNL